MVSLTVNCALLHRMPVPSADDEDFDPMSILAVLGGGLSLIGLGLLCGGPVLSLGLQSTKNKLLHKHGKKVELFDLVTTCEREYYNDSWHTIYRNHAKYQLEEGGPVYCYVRQGSPEPLKRPVSWQVQPVTALALPSHPNLVAGQDEMSDPCCILSWGAILLTIYSITIQAILSLCGVTDWLGAILAVGIAWWNVALVYIFQTSCNGESSDLCDMKSILWNTKKGPEQPGSTNEEGAANYREIS